MPSVQRNCTNCGSPFTARQADVNRGWAKFCGKSCKAKKQEKTTGTYREYLAYQNSYELQDNILAPEHSQDDTI